jgi:hypothetical protein
MTDDATAAKTQQEREETPEQRDLHGGDGHGKPDKSPREQNLGDRATDQYRAVGRPVPNDLRPIVRSAYDTSPTSEPTVAVERVCRSPAWRCPARIRAATVDDGQPSHRSRMFPWMIPVSSGVTRTDPTTPPKDPGALAEIRQPSSGNLPMSYLEPKYILYI